MSLVVFLQNENEQYLSDYVLPEYWEAEDSLVEVSGFTINYNKSFFKSYEKTFMKKN